MTIEELPEAEIKGDVSNLCRRNGGWGQPPSLFPVSGRAIVPIAAEFFWVCLNSWLFYLKSMSDLPNRKRPSHNDLLEIRGRSNILFVTVAAKVRRPIFASDAVHCTFLEAWSKADHWIVGRYVIMPDHVHLFCAPKRYPPTPLRNWVKYWKRLVSLSGTLPKTKGVWLQDCWDTQMRTGAHYTEKWAYVRENPVRAGLVDKAEDWPYAGEIELLDWRGR